MCAGAMHKWRETCKSQVCTSWLSSSTTWGLGIRLRLLGVAARAFADLATMSWPRATFVATFTCVFALPRPSNHCGLSAIWTDTVKLTVKV